MEGEETAAAKTTASPSSSSSPSRYETQKRRHWISFLQHLKTHHEPPLALSRCSGPHVIEFLKHLDMYGKTKVHVAACPYFGDPNPPSQCGCPHRQAWGSLDSLVGRLRAAFEDIGGGARESNPFAAKAVGMYLKEVRGAQAKARGIPYGKMKRKQSLTAKTSTAGFEPARAKPN